MNTNYNKYLKKLNNESVKETLTLTFNRVFPKILSLYEDEKIQAQVFISFSELLQSAAANGFSSQITETNAFYHVYTEFCDALFSLIEYSEEKATIYSILETVCTHIISDRIIEGLGKGTITPEDLVEP